MPQHDMVLANADGATFRADANSALAALVAQSSGATAPATMFAYMFWADTTTGLLKIRNAANSAWITIGTLATANLALASLAANTFTGTQTWKKGADIASATTLVLGTDGNYFDVTGTTTITGITVAAGTFFMLQFDGILTFTHHATNLVLPGAANIATAAGDRLIGFAEAANQVRVVAYTKASGAAVVSSSGKLVAVSYAQTTAVATGTTAIPNDDTIPQITEGTEFITLAHTMATSSNQLLILIELMLSNAGGAYVTTALFVDATAGALAAAHNYEAVSAPFSTTLNYKHSPGDTSAHTYRVRVGDQSANTITINGQTGARKLGGVLTSSITILELTP